jgi:hypothetical protein
LTHRLTETPRIIGEVGAKAVTALRDLVEEAGERRWIAAMHEAHDALSSSRPSFAVAPAALIRHRKEKRLRQFEGLPYILRTRTDPIIDLHDAYIPALHDGFVDCPRLLVGLLEACHAELSCDRVFIRAHPDVRFDTPPLTLYEEFFLKAPGDHGVEQRSLTGTVVPTSDPFVRGLLLQATVNAYTSGGFLSRYRTEQAERFVDHLASLPNIRSVVGLLDGLPIGHVTWLEGVDDDITGEALSEIIDVYILEDFRTRGFSNEFVGFVEETATCGHRLHGSVLNEGTIPSPVSRRLLNSGWCADFNLWVRECHAD